MKIGSYGDLGPKYADRTDLTATAVARRLADVASRSPDVAVLRALGELLELDFEAMPLMRLVRASDALVKHRAALEDKLFASAHSLFALEETVLIGLSHTPTRFGDP